MQVPESAIECNHEHQSEKLCGVLMDHLGLVILCHIWRWKNDMSNL